MSERENRNKTSGIESEPASPASVPTRRTECARDILIVGADADLFGLIEEWLTAAGYVVVVDAESANVGNVGLVIADIPSPRQGGHEMLHAFACRWPGTPILAISSAFFPGIECNGAVARTLGVAGVLPKPLTQTALEKAVTSLLPCVE